MKQLDLFFDCVKCHYVGSAINLVRCPKCNDWLDLEVEAMLERFKQRATT